MKRLLALAAMLALALPTLALAQGQNSKQHGPKTGGPRPGGNRTIVHQHTPMLRTPTVQQHGVQQHGAPRGVAVVVRGQFSYHGHNFNRVHLAPFVYPRGWAYRRWAAGAILPPLFLVPAYFYADYAGLGLEPPPPGFQWVRYGPDLLLVDVRTGQVRDVIYGAFY